MRNLYWIEAIRFLGCWMVGWLLALGDFTLGLLFGLLAFSSWHAWQMMRFVRWLRVGNKSMPHDVYGVWDEFYSYVYGLRKRTRKRKKRLVRLLQKFYETAAAMPDATVILSDDFKIDWWNDAAKRLLKLKEADKGNRIDNIVRNPKFVHFIAKGSFGEALEIVSPADESIVLSVQIIPYGKKQRLFLASDVTQVRMLEQTRRDFIANVSHELKTPLTVISGFLENMDSDPALSEQWKTPVALMSEQSQRMTSLVEDLLFLSRLENNERPSVAEPIDIRQLLTQLYSEAQSMNEKRGHEITLEIETDEEFVGDIQEIRSAFSNLISNAINYTPDGGRIHIRWYRQEQSFRFEVEDNGDGIPKRYLNRLSERFYRVDHSRSRQSGGTGLGLAIVKHVANRHEGVLEIQSEESKGSKFSCVFPLVRAVSKDFVIKSA